MTVDGADNINTATGSQRATPSQEAVSEFRVVNNSFGAEYGRALGGIVRDRQYCDQVGYECSSRLGL